MLVMKSEVQLFGSGYFTYLGWLKGQLRWRLERKALFVFGFGVRSKGV